MNNAGLTKNQDRRRSVRLLVTLVASAMLVGACAVGPDFHRPLPPSAEHYTTEPLLTQTAATPSSADQAQQFLLDRDIPADWWTGFNSPALNALVIRALKNSPTVTAAQAALRQAAEIASAQRGAYFPAAQAGYAASRHRDAVGTIAPTLNSGAPIYNLYDAQVSVSYLLDVFGANRRQLESAEALVESQRFQLEATYLTLTANVVNAAIQEAALRSQVSATRAIIQSERELLEIMRRQNSLGLIAMADVIAQDAILAQTEATLPLLNKQLAQQRDLLAVLTGQFPGEAALPLFELSSFTLPAELPVSVPAKLIDQRPDVRAAEAQMHAASAQLGVAISNLLPQITLTAYAGSAAEQMAELFKSGNGFWSLGASLTQTLFQGGTLVHRKRAAAAALDQAGAQYRSAVLTAFQNVADSLYALQSDADAVAMELRAQQAAAASLDVTRRNLELGSVSEINVLSAQQLYQQAEINLTQARANRYTDTVALYQALGGGWWNRNDNVAH